MALPKWLVTVTPFSKFFALALFVSLPVLSFFFGREYQKLLAIKNEKVEVNLCPSVTPEVTITPGPTQAELFVKFCLHVPDSSLYDGGQVFQCGDVYRVGPGPRIIDGDAYIFDAQGEVAGTCPGMPSPEEQKKMPAACSQKCQAIGRLNCSLPIETTPEDVINDWPVLTLTPPANNVNN